MATVDDLERLLEVQGLDIRIDQLHHQRATLGDRAALATAESQLGGVESELAAVEQRHDELSRSQNRVQDDVALVQAKATEVDKRLYSGTVTNPRELQDMQAELDSLRRRQSTLEDEILEIMEATEPVVAERTRLESERDRLAAEAAALRASIAAAEATLDGELANVQAKRSEMVAAVPSPLLDRYERLRPRLDGIAVARLDGSRCGGCHLTLPATELDQIRRQAPDAVVSHEECGRILVR